MPGLGSTSAGKMLVASAALHVGLAMAVGGHAPGSSLARVAAGSAVRELEVSVVPLAEPAAPAPAPAPDEARPRASAHPTHTHTHPYPVPASHDATPHDPSLVHTPLALAPPASVADDAPLVTSAVGAPARFTMTLGATVAAHPVGTVDHDDGPSAAEEETFTEGGVDARPALVASSPLPYPAAAASAGFEADVTVEILVDAAGRVLDARPLTHTGYGLEEAAARALRGYRFTPGRRGGHPVRVRMPWVVSFRLR